MSFSDFINMKKNNDEEDQDQQLTAPQESQPALQELYEVQKKLDLIMNKLQVLGEQEEEREKNLLVKVKENIDKAASKVVGQKNEEMEKIIIKNNSKFEAIIALQIALLIASYAVLCTSLAIAQQIFNISGFWGIWSMFKLATGLKLLF